MTILITPPDMQSTHERLYRYVITHLADTLTARRRHISEIVLVGETLHPNPLFFSKC